MRTTILRGIAAVPLLLLSAHALSQPVVVVLDHGATPREELRYRFTADETSQATMSMDMKMSMSMANMQVPPVSIPAIRVPMSLHTTEVLPDGSARYDFEVAAPEVAEGSGEAGANPMIDMALQASLGTLEGTTGWGWIDARGQALDGGMNAPANAFGGPGTQVMGNLQNQIQQLSAPFPAEAVGVGARWQVTTSTSMAGVDLVQTADYTLLSRNGDQIELEVAVKQSADIAGSSVAVSLPPEVSAAASAMNGTLGSEGTGTMTVDLNSTLPYSDMKMVSTTSIGGEGQPGVRMTIEMNMVISPD
jgi:hypothetical protein